MDLNILIATPCYNGQVYASYTESLISTINIFNSMNIKYNIHFIKNQIVTRARNMLSHIFLKEENNYTHMIFIDADVVWQPQHILYLLQHNKECVIGIYPNKSYDENYNLASSSKIKLPINIENNLFEVTHAATGFMLLNKKALERIKDKIDFFYLPCGKNNNEKIYNFFDCNIVNNDYLTEDYYFSHLFNESGGNIYADNRIHLKHCGTHEYFKKLI